MQQCHICEKQVFGHPSSKKLVCGSCTLTKTLDEKAGKSVFQVNLDLFKTTTKKAPERTEPIVMSEILLKSNFPRDWILVLDGKHVISFDKNGNARCPSYLAPALETEMTVKPGRFIIVGSEEVKPSPTPVIEEVKEEPTPVIEEPEIIVPPSEEDSEEEELVLDPEYAAIPVEEIVEQPKKKASRKK